MKPLVKPEVLLVLPYFDVAAQLLSAVYSQGFRTNTPPKLQATVSSMKELKALLKEKLKGKDAEAFTCKGEVINKLADFGSEDKIKARIEIRSGSVGGPPSDLVQTDGRPPLEFVHQTSGPLSKFEMLLTPEGGSTKVVCEVSSLAKLEQKIKADLPGNSATDSITILQGGSRGLRFSARQGQAHRAAAGEF